MIFFIFYFFTDERKWMSNKRIMKWHSSFFLVWRNMVVEFYFHKISKYSRCVSALPRAHGYSLKNYIIRATYLPYLYRGYSEVFFCSSSNFLLLNIWWFMENPKKNTDFLCLQVIKSFWKFKPKTILVKCIFVVSIAIVIVLWCHLFIE